STSSRQSASLIPDSIARLGAVPGVTGAAVTCCLPLESDWRTSVQITGQAVDLSVDALPGERLVSPSYFDVLHIPVLRGRGFDDSDAVSSAGVAVVNQAMAARFWPDQDPLGEQIRIFPGRVAEATSPIRTIVGVVGNVRDGWALSETAR